MDLRGGEAEILFDHEDPEFMLELLARRPTHNYGPNHALIFEAKSRLASLCLQQGRYAEALKALFDIYIRKMDVFGLKHPRTLDTRICILDILWRYGSPEVTSQALWDARRVFRHQKKIIRKMYLQGRYREAMTMGLDILEDMVLYLGPDNPITLDMSTIIAMIYSTSEEYKYCLEILEDMYEKKRHMFGPLDRRTADSLMRKAYILFKMCDFEKAMKCYNQAYEIRKYVLGPFHRKTLISMRSVAEVVYTVGKYEDALFILTKLAERLEARKRRESILARIHTGILQCARGKYKRALAIFRKIRIQRNTPKRIIAQIQQKKGILLTALGRKAKGRYVLIGASRIIRTTHFSVETLDICRNVAVALAKEEKFPTAHVIFDMLIEVCELTLNAGHSMALSIENDLGDFYFSTEQFNEAIRIFTKLWNFQNLNLGSHHPDTLYSKCQIAKVFNKLGQVEDALRMYNEVLPELDAQFYLQQTDCLLVQSQMASIYLSRNSYVKAYDMYYKIYEITKIEYGANDRYTRKVIKKMETFADTVPLRRLIQAAMMESIEDIMTFVADGDDVNARDVNGAVTLHYASREGYVDIVKYLLSKGAIYDIKDTAGNTPESLTTDNSTKFVFLLVQRLFECVEINDRLQVRRIILKEKLIMNARNAYRRTPLHQAVAMGHIEVVKELLAHGADVSLANEDYGTVLHTAAERGHGLIMDTILCHLHHVNFELCRSLIDNKDNNIGATPLHLAAKKNSVKCVNVLIKYRANPMIKDIFDLFPYDFGPNAMKQRLLVYSYNFLNGNV